MRLIIRFQVKNIMPFSDELTLHFSRNDISTKGQWFIWAPIGLKVDDLEFGTGLYDFEMPKFFVTDRYYRLDDRTNSFRVFGL